MQMRPKCDRIPIWINKWVCQPWAMNLLRCEPRKKSSLQRLTASFRGENGLNWFVRATIKESVVTSPTIWNECFASTWFRTCTIFRTWRLFLKWSTAASFQISVVLNPVARFRMETHWDTFESVDGKQSVATPVCAGRVASDRTQPHSQKGDDCGFYFYWVTILCQEPGQKTGSGCPLRREG